MADVVTRLTGALLALSGVTAYLVLGGLAFAEAALFVGVVFPGETALLLGGVLAEEGRVAFPVMLAVGVVAAVAGDSVGYQVGRLFGPAVRGSWLGRRIGERRWQSAERFVARRGGVAVFLGRWTALMRALVPCLAGMSRMPYRRFLVYNAAGGALWASVVVTAGYVAGASFRQVQHALGQGGAVLLGALAAFAVVALAARWVSHHPARVADAVRAVAGTRAVSAVVSGAAWLRRRLGPHRAAVVVAVAGAAAVTLLSLGFAAVSDAVLEGDGIATLDRPTLGWLVSHRVGDLTEVMRVVTHGADVGTLAVLGVVGAVLAAVGMRRVWPLLLCAVALPGAGVIVTVTKALVGRARPPLPDALVRASGASFPSGHTLGAVVTFGVFAYLACCALRSWHARVWTIAVAVSAVGVIGLSRLYLAAHWLTDVIGSCILGGAWLAACLVTCSLFLRRTDRPG